MKLKDCHVKDGVLIFFFTEKASLSINFSTIVNTAKLNVKIQMHYLKILHWFVWCFKINRLFFLIQRHKMQMIYYLWNEKPVTSTICIGIVVFFSRSNKSIDDDSLDIFRKRIYYAARQTDTFIKFVARNIICSSIIWIWSNFHKHEPWSCEFTYPFY